MSRPQLHLILLIAAIVAFVVFTFAAASWVTVTHPDGWLGAGLALFAASFLP